MTGRPGPRAEEGLGLLHAARDAVAGHVRGGPRDRPGGLGRTDRRRGYGQGYGRRDPQRRTPDNSEVVGGQMDAERPRSTFACDILRIRLTIWRSSPGRPGRCFRPRRIQKRRNPSRCQRITVAGWTMARASFQHERPEMLRRSSRRSKISPPPPRRAGLKRVGQGPPMGDGKLHAAAASSSNTNSSAGI